MKEGFFKKFDILLLFICIVLFIIGLVAVQSAESTSFLPLADTTIKQIIFFSVGFVIMCLLANTDYDALGKFAYPIAFINIIILVIVFFAGHSAKGAQRWIAIGPITYQPSEPTKIIVIVALAKILSSVEKIDKTTIFSVVFTVLAPWFLILVQPDLGTSLVILFAAFIMLYFAGVKPWILISIALGGMAVAPWVLHDYQKQRLFIFMNPNADLTDTGWNIYQSKIAVGHGGIFGTGLFSGSQTQLDFVPEHNTDFIFSILGEETGFIGCIIVLLLYVIIMLRCIAIIKSSKDKFGFLIGVGIFCLMGFHVFINIGMVLGIMPVVGIPLIFISSGGSALISNMMSIGILESIYSQRERFPSL